MALEILNLPTVVCRLLVIGHFYFLYFSLYAYWKDKQSITWKVCGRTKRASLMETFFPFAKLQSKTVGKERNLEMINFLNTLQMSVYESVLNLLVWNRSWFRGPLTKSDQSKNHNSFFKLILVFLASLFASSSNGIVLLPVNFHTRLPCHTK